MNSIHITSSLWNDAAVASRNQRKIWWWMSKHESKKIWKADFGRAFWYSLLNQDLDLVDLDWNEYPAIPMQEILATNWNKMGGACEALSTSKFGSFGDSAWMHVQYYYWKLQALNYLKQGQFRWKLFKSIQMHMHAISHNNEQIWTQYYNELWMELDFWDGYSYCSNWYSTMQYFYCDEAE